MYLFFVKMVTNLLNTNIRLIKDVENYMEIISFLIHWKRQVFNAVAGLIPSQS